MEMLATVILYIFILNGAFMLIFPDAVYGIVNWSNTIKKSNKRYMGAATVIAAALLFYLTRKFMVSLTVHWVIVLTSLAMALKGLIGLIVPGSVTKVSAWYASEKGVVRITGLVFVVGAIIILKLI